MAVNVMRLEGIKCVRRVIRRELTSGPAGDIIITVLAKEVKTMKYTSAEANKLLRSLNEEHDNLINQEDNSKSFVAATIEDIEDVRPDYDYAEMQAKLDELETKIRRVKHAINVFNSTTVIPDFGVTIDEMLILIPQLTNRKFRLGNMANALPKTRERSSFQSGIIDYRYTNYDVAAAEADAKAASDMLARAQTALDKINSTETMDIDI